ncbi:helix-turn-helix domain-containing protein [Thalassospira sp. HJ]|uniref:helix-turn-helix domain-containing protein n=1 Tax=Thalassospira sp. HJ TaxID=1616823 RepID=UPI0009E38DAC|nr:helix-turn-helix domain-containing protein [Thalassospira sp. HJ]
MTDTPQNTHTFFTVNDLPMSVRYDIWKSSIDCIFDVETVPDIRKNDFHATLDADLMGSMMLARTISKHQFWKRSPSAIAADGMDHYMVQYFHGGGMSSEEGKDGGSLAQGGLLFQDLSQVATAVTTDFDNLVMIFPRKLLENRLTLPEDHNMRFLSPRDPMVRILASMMLSFKENAHSFSPEQASVLENSFVEVLATCLNAAHGGTSETAHQRQNLETMALIRQYFRKNFKSPDLTPDRAARELGISRSKLYQLMEDHGGVYRFIRDLRLRHAMSLLGSPAERNRSLYDIALECGFASDTSFIRAFREKYDMTPGDFRRNAQAVRKGIPDASDEERDTRYEKWLHSL